jgi:hypothetical protein
MNKKIKTEVAIGIILISAIIAGAVIWSLGKQHFNNNQAIENFRKEIRSKDLLQSNSQFAPGDYGPFDFDNTMQEVSISVSDHNWGVVFQNSGKYQVVVNNENKGIFDNPIHEFKVTDKFYGFEYPKDGKWFVRINSNNYGPFDDNVKLLVSNNNWAIQYTDKTSQHNKAIVNGKTYDDYVNQVAISDNFFGVVYGVKDEKLNMNSFVVLNDKKYGPYSGWPGAYLSVNDNGWLINRPGKNENTVLVNDKEYSLNLGDMNLGDCLVYNPDIWGCDYPDKDGSWYVMIYENGNKNKYGPYGKYTDPREQASLAMTKDGFMLNLGNQLIIKNNGAEKKIRKSEIGFVQSSGNHSGYLYEQDKNYYVNIDGKDYGPYENVDNFIVTDNGWGFNYLKSDETGAIINRTIHTDAVGDVSLSKNNWATGYMKDGKLYVKIGANQ